MQGCAGPRPGPVTVTRPTAEQGHHSQSQSRSAEPEQVVMQSQLPSGSCSAALDTGDYTNTWWADVYTAVRVSQHTSNTVP